MCVKHTDMAEQHQQHQHDEVGSDGEYKKRCYCEKCVAKYDLWCKEHAGEAHVTCKRKCYTVCEINCHKEQTFYKDWAFGKKYEGKWEEYSGKDHEPSKCECGSDSSECSCKDKKPAFEAQSKPQLKALPKAQLKTKAKSRKSRK